MKISIVIISWCLVSLLSACAVSPRVETAHEQPLRETKHISEQSIHQYVELLSKQLLLTAKPINLTQSIAVGTFLPTENIGGKNMPSTNLLGQQIQESFITLATQAGLNVVEYKTAKAIKIQQNQDLMLSRKVSEINPYVQADYYLTGTYTAEQEKIAINARLIETSNQRVIAAATDFIPSNVMWEQDRIIMKDDKIYRKAY